MASGSQYEFGSYRLDMPGGTLFREGNRVALPPKVAEFLVSLVQAAGSVVTREQLLQQVWPGSVIEEGSLSSHISILRKALGTAPNGQDFIETLPKRGYRFAAHVKRPGFAAPVGGTD
jgi:DNA-binding winged helix-turn-helix (wHTH) protein